MSPAEEPSRTRSVYAHSHFEWAGHSFDISIIDWDPNDIMDLDYGADWTCDGVPQVPPFRLGAKGQLEAILLARRCIRKLYPIPGQTP